MRTAPEGGDAAAPKHSSSYSGSVTYPGKNTNNMKNKMWVWDIYVKEDIDEQRDVIIDEALPEWTTSTTTTSTKNDIARTTNALDSLVAKYQPLYESAATIEEAMEVVGYVMLCLRNDYHCRFFKHYSLSLDGTIDFVLSLDEAENMDKIVEAFEAKRRRLPGLGKEQQCDQSDHLVNQRQAEPEPQSASSQSPFSRKRKHLAMGHGEEKSVVLASSQTTQARVLANSPDWQAEQWARIRQEFGYNDLNRKTDIIVGSSGRYYLAEALEEVGRKYIERFQRSKGSEKRDISLFVMQELMRKGCRLIKCDDRKYSLELNCEKGAKKVYSFLDKVENKPKAKGKSTKSKARQQLEARFAKIRTTSAYSPLAKAIDKVYTDEQQQAELLVGETPTRSFVASSSPFAARDRTTCENAPMDNTVNGILVAKPQHVASSVATGPSSHSPITESEVAADISANDDAALEAVSSLDSNQSPCHSQLATHRAKM